jgi:8-oxo-dGTP pyrophosphatase MutT (NUDIX family)
LIQRLRRGLVKGPTLADLIDEAEISGLNADYGPGERRRVTLDVSAENFDNWLRKLVNSPNRRGEVVLAIQRPDRQTLLHTKRFYPEGVYRLPSGGVHPDEPVLSGVTRETKEETGLDVFIDRFLGMVEYEFCHGDQALFFVSYVFLVRADSEEPVVQDPDEQITGFRYVAPPEIRGVADQLRALPTKWADWGHFRALPHDLVADVLGA